MDAAAIIRALGGPVALAERLRVSRTAVANWTRNGIPARFWFEVIDLAAAAGVDGVTRDTVRWRPPADAQPASQAQEA